MMDKYKDERGEKEWRERERGAEEEEEEEEDSSLTSEQEQNEEVEVEKKKKANEQTTTHKLRVERRLLFLLSSSLPSSSPLHSTMSQWLAGQAGRYDASSSSSQAPQPAAAEESRTPPSVRRSRVAAAAAAAASAAAATATSASASSSVAFRSGNERLYEAYNDLHALAQDFQKPFDAPAILVVGHQTDGKSGKKRERVFFSREKFEQSTCKKNGETVASFFLSRLNAPPRSVSFVFSPVSREGHRLPLATLRKRSRIKYVWRREKGS